MKYDISKKTAPKVVKLGKMNENSAIFALTDIKIHARTYRSDDFPCSRSARNWSQIHVSWPHLEEIMRQNGQSRSRIGRDKGQFTNITEAIPHRTLAYLRCRNDALRLKKTSKITRTVRLERAESPKALSPGQWIQAARPEGAEALSPGQRPGCSSNRQGAL